MGCAKGIHHEYITKRRHLLGQAFIISFLADIKTHVFTQHYLTLVDFKSVEPVSDQTHALVQQRTKMLCNRRQRVRALECSFFGTSKVRHQHHPGTGFDSRLDCGKRCADPGVAGDKAVLNRNIQIFPDQHALCCEILIGHLQYIHGADTRWVLAKPCEPSTQFFICVNGYPGPEKKPRR